MKKRLSILFTLIIAVVFAGGTVMAESYSVVPWPTSMLNSALFSADLVIEGTILDDGRQFYVTDKNGYKVAYECMNNNMFCSEVDNLADFLSFSP
ncbi:MAG: hypothetical protein IJD13_05070, partial [Oscillospiraceae bacterium]|nr:hypothetical protein [Oscillospiraceae bacterium]